MIELSKLPHTWIFDIDGTLVKHNGYIIDGHDTLLQGVKDFFSKLPKQDKIILLTARKKEYIEDLELFLKNNNIRYDCLLADIPAGERILINDDKPSGLTCAYAVCKKRNERLDINYKINNVL